MRVTGSYVTSTTLGESVQAFVPHTLPPAAPVLDTLRDPKGLPLSVCLLRQAHRLLMDGARGAGSQPGELRKSQNWFGGTRPGNAVFVPAPPEHVPALLADLESFIHQTDTYDTLPPFELLPLMPRFSIDQVCERLNTTFPTATAAVKILETLGIVAEQTGQKKNRHCSYPADVELLSN